MFEVAFCLWPRLMEQCWALALCGALLGMAQLEARAGDKPVEAEHGMVVSVSVAASEVGLQILKKGGNAVDAAVAPALCPARAHPQAAQPGGGSLYGLPS